ncbi:hypothetical protein CVT26_000058 [Gymnopilus dilepis]|uniref:MalT-like TPR region domain-containing protein n=1 Tax=Gymnopilus dilepis TaxID=231916 RepID=A0A409VGE7_9AGAR|nr:hypothetical protein CVT26_000058 [Gymnopilus dilepis]
MDFIRDILCCGLLIAFFSIPKSEKCYRKATKDYETYSSSGTPGDREVLKKALENYQAALDARAEEGNSDIAEIAIDYAVALWTDYQRYERSSKTLDKVIKLYEAALAQWKGAVSKPEGYPNLLLNSANAYFTQYRVEKEAAALEKAISYLDELRQLKAADETRKNCLFLLGKVLMAAYSANGTATDRLDDAIKYFRQALKLATPDDAEKGTEDEQDSKGAGNANFQIQCLYNLSTAYDLSYQKTTKIEDLDEAIKYNYEARNLLASTPNHPDHAACLYNLARQLFTKYQRSQQDKVGIALLDTNLDGEKGVQDLNAAHRLAKEAQDMLPAENPMRGPVDELLAVIGQHDLALSKHTKSLKSKSSSMDTLRSSRSSRS